MQIVHWKRQNGRIAFRIQKQKYICHNFGNYDNGFSFCYGRTKLMSIASPKLHVDTSPETVYDANLVLLVQGYNEKKNSTILTTNEFIFERIKKIVKEYNKYIAKRVKNEKRS